MFLVHFSEMSNFQALLSYPLLKKKKFQARSLKDHGDENGANKIRFWLRLRK